MVDLPNTYTTSTEHLDQIEEYPLSSNPAKSQSVPRLTFMTVSAESEKSEYETEGGGGTGVRVQNMLRDQLH